MISLQMRSRKPSERLGHRVQPSGVELLRLSTRVRAWEHLVRSLTERVNDADSSEPLNWVLNIIQIFGAAVRQMLKDVGRLDGGLASLLETENKINPLMQVLAHIRAFQSLAVLCNKDMWITLGQGGSLTSPTSSLLPCFAPKSYPFMFVRNSGR